MTGSWGLAEREEKAVGTEEIVRTQLSQEKLSGAREDSVRRQENP